MCFSRFPWIRFHYPHRIISHNVSILILIRKMKKWSYHYLLDLPRLWSCLFFGCEREKQTTLCKLGWGSVPPPWWFIQTPQFLSSHVNRLIGIHTSAAFVPGLFSWLFFQYQDAGSASVWACSLSRPASLIFFLLRYVPLNQHLLTIARQVLFPAKDPTLHISE